MSELTVRYHSPTSLHPRLANPRTNSKRQIPQTASSILAFGFANPILVDADLNVLAGYGRLERAMTQDWLERIP